MTSLQSKDARNTIRHARTAISEGNMSTFINLRSEYSGEVTVSDNSEWSALTSKFLDTSVYQTWAFGAARFGPSVLKHVILTRSDGEVAAIAQVAVLKLARCIPVAHMYWGPLWRRMGESGPNYQVLRTMLSLLREEFCHKRGMYLRLLPRDADDAEHTIARIYREEGFRSLKFVPPYRTLLLDLSLPVEQLRSELRATWRRGLNRAERLPLTVEKGTDSRLFREALYLHEQMRARKKFAQFVDMQWFAGAQTLLPEADRLTVLICRHEGEAVAAMAYSNFGDTTVPILAATSQKALKLCASNLLWWRMLQDLKGRGMRWCDIGGIDPEHAPGTYFFRSSVAGQSSREITCVGVYALTPHGFLMAIAQTAEWLRARWRRLFQATCARFLSHSE